MTIKFAFFALALFVVGTAAVKQAPKPIVAPAKHAVVAPPAEKFPAPVCYKKVTECCFKYGTCGVKIIKKRVNAKCPEARPEKKCIKVCKPVVKLGTTKKCWKKLAFGLPKCVDHPWLPKVCVKPPVIKEVCKDVQTKTVTMPCVDKCHIVKKIWIQPCYYFKIFHATKFCAKLSCGKETTLGTSAKPPVVVSKIERYIKKTKVTNYGTAIPHKW